MVFKEYFFADNGCDMLSSCVGAGTWVKYLVQAQTTTLLLKRTDLVLVIF